MYKKRRAAQRIPYGIESARIINQSITANISSKNVVRQKEN